MDKTWKSKGIIEGQPLFIAAGNEVICEFRWGDPRIIEDNIESNVRMMEKSKKMFSTLVSSCKTFEWYANIHREKHGIESEKFKRNNAKFIELKTLIEEVSGLMWEDLKK